MADEKGDVRFRIRKDVEAFMKSIGSTTSEVMVYMALVKLKRYSGVKEVQEATKLSEKSVRNALKRLIDKGLVVEKEAEGKKLYRAKPVKELMELWRKKMEEFISSLFNRP